MRNLLNGSVIYRFGSGLLGINKNLLLITKTNNICFIILITIPLQQYLAMLPNFINYHEPIQ